MQSTQPAIYSSRTADKFVVRLPEGMRARIAMVARGQRRSMNSEIIARLEQSLHQDEQTGSLSTASLQSSEISASERELLLHFRQLSRRQQAALLALINHDLKQA